MKVLSRSFLGEGSYITYPHTNAFAFGGRVLIYGQMSDGIHGLYARNLATGETTRLPDIAPRSIRGMACDIAMHAPKMAAIFQNGAWILDLDTPSHWRCVYQSPASSNLDSLCSLASDGSRLVCMESSDGVCRAVEFDLKRGAQRVLFSKNWHANHIQYCHYDESWVAFSHEGPAQEILDRCWVWHQENAPHGIVAFDQGSDEPGKPLCVGHERWGFHDVSGYVIAYAVSPAGKRGIYEIFADGRPARLLWENDVLWHCNMDPTGRFAVVDTTGPFRDEGLTEREFCESVDRHLQTDRENGQNASDVVVIDLQTRQTLHISEARRSRHPFHPHPAISPDRNWIIWNDDNREARGAWLAAVSLE